VDPAALFADTAVEALGAVVVVEVAEEEAPNPEKVDLSAKTMEPSWKRSLRRSGLTMRLTRNLDLHAWNRV
jgi:hypothetical protein